jgi:hypothetical protein
MLLLVPLDGIFKVLSDALFELLDLFSPCDEQKSFSVLCELLGIQLCSIKLLSTLIRRSCTLEQLVLVSSCVNFSKRVHIVSVTYLKQKVKEKH